MPELPEVETTAKSIRSRLVGRTITAVHLRWPRHTPNPAMVQERLPGRRVAEVGRRGKFVVVHLEPADLTLLIHLGMSGRLEIGEPGAETGKHTHTILALDNGRQLHFSDARKFGRLYLLSDLQSVLGKLGPEPLSETFTAEWLAQSVAQRRRAIKTLLLDQHFLAGLGNIYADESLHRAGVDPRRRADGLSGEEAALLRDAIREVLTEAITHQGTSLDWVYPGGTMQLRLRVYGKGGQQCAACGTVIERVVLGQRSTHYCPHCQR